MNPSLPIGILSCVCLASTLAAQDSEPPVGAHVRLQTAGPHGERLAGRFVALEAGSLALRVADRPDPVVVQRSSIEKLEVRRRAGKKGRGALVGFLAGTAIGAVATIANSGSSACDSSSVSGCDLVLSAVLLGVPGAVIGAMVAPGSQWEELPSDGVRVRVVPLVDRTRRGAAISVSFRRRNEARWILQSSGKEER